MKKKWEETDLSENWENIYVQSRFFHFYPGCEKQFVEMPQDYFRPSLQEERILVNRRRNLKTNTNLRNHVKVNKNRAEKYVSKKLNSGLDYKRSTLKSSKLYFLPVVKLHDVLKQVSKVNHPILMEKEVFLDYFQLINTKYIIREKQNIVQCCKGVRTRNNIKQNKKENLTLINRLKVLYANKNESKLLPCVCLHDISKFSNGNTMGKANLRRNISVRDNLKNTQFKVSSKTVTKKTLSKAKRFERKSLFLKKHIKMTSFETYKTTISSVLSNNKLNICKNTVSSKLLKEILCKQVSVQLQTMPEIDLMIKSLKTHINLTSLETYKKIRRITPRKNIRKKKRLCDRYTSKLLKKFCCKPVSVRLKTLPEIDLMVKDEKLKAFVNTKYAVNLRHVSNGIIST